MSFNVHVYRAFENKIRNKMIEAKVSIMGPKKIKNCEFII